MKALVLTSEYYGAPTKIGSHHLAEQFARSGIEVYLVSFPVSPAYRLVRARTRFTEREPLTKGFVRAADNLSIHVPSALVPPLPSIVRWLPGWLSHWQVLTRPRLEKTLAAIPGREVDFLLTDTLFFPFIEQYLDIGKTVFRIPDWFSGFWGKNPALSRRERELAESADLLVTSSHVVRERIECEFGVSAGFLPNGVDLARYREIAPEPPEYRRSTRRKAVYTGAVGWWFDEALLTQVAGMLPGWDFFIIGDSSRLKIDRGINNVHLLGTREPIECVAYQQHADAGIIPFAGGGSDLVDSINPLKLYEYLAAGIPVVTGEWRELERIAAPVTRAASADEFAAGIESCLPDTDEKRKARREFAARFDWSEIAHTLLDMIRSTGSESTDR